MSPAFIKVITDEFPLSSVIFDKFHIIKLVNEATDEVRRLEQLMNQILKNTRYIWLKNLSSLTKKN
jgi:transposase